MRVRDSVPQLERQRDRIERVAVTENDQRLRAYGGEVWRRKADVVVAVSQAPGDLEELLDLRRAMAVTRAHALHFFVSEHRFGELPLDLAHLRREVRRCADQTIASMEAGCMVAMCSRVMPPPLKPMALTPLRFR